MNRSEPVPEPEHHARGVFGAKLTPEPDDDIYAYDIIVCPRHHSPG